MTHQLTQKYRYVEETWHKERLEYFPQIFQPARSSIDVDALTSNPVLFQLYESTHTWLRYELESMPDTKTDIRKFIAAIKANLEIATNNEIPYECTPHFFIRPVPEQAAEYIITRGTKTELVMVSASVIKAFLDVLKTHLAVYFPREYEYVDDLFSGYGLPCWYITETIEYRMKHGYNNNCHSAPLNVFVEDDSAAELFGSETESERGSIVSYDGEPEGEFEQEYEFIYEEHAQSEAYDDDGTYDSMYDSDYDYFGGDDVDLYDSEDEEGDDYEGALIAT